MSWKKCIIDLRAFIQAVSTQHDCPGTGWEPDRKSVGSSKKRI